MIYSPESFKLTRMEKMSETMTNIEELKKPELSPRFDVD
jgi:hypothetical protein